MEKVPLSPPLVSLWVAQRKRERGGEREREREREGEGEKLLQEARLSPADSGGWQ